MSKEDSGRKGSKDEAGRKMSKDEAGRKESKVEEVGPTWKGLCTGQLLTAKVIMMISKKMISK